VTPSPSPIIIGQPIVALNVELSPATAAAVANVTVARALREAFASVMGVPAEAAFLAATLDVASGVVAVFSTSDACNIAGNGAANVSAVEGVLAGLVIPSVSATPTATGARRRRLLGWGDGSAGVAVDGDGLPGAGRDAGVAADGRLGDGRAVSDEGADIALRSATHGRGPPVASSPRSLHPRST